MIRIAKFTGPILLLAPLLTSCCAARHLNQHHVQRDSVVVSVTETLRDTVMVIEPDKSVLRALVECDSIGRVHLVELLEYRAGEHLKPPTVSVRNNVLTAESRIDSLSVYLQWRERHETRTERHTEVVHDTVEVNRLNGWQRFWMRTGQILAAVIALTLGLKLRKLLPV